MVATCQRKHLCVVSGHLCTFLFIKTYFQALFILLCQIKHYHTICIQSCNILCIDTIVTRVTLAHELGYEPAGLTVHPPPQNDRGWVHFFRMGV